MFRNFLIAVLFLTMTAPGVRAAPLLDLMILVDGSGSISPSDYEDQRALVQQFADGFSYGPADTSLGILEFSTFVTPQIGLSQNKSAIDAAIAAMSQSFGQTNHGDAFIAAHNELNLNGRAGARQAIVLLTDGTANEPTSVNPIVHAVTAANAAKIDGIEIFAIGFGNDIDLSDLALYSSGPDFQFHVADFQGGSPAINDIIDELNPSSTAVASPAPLAIIAVGIGGLALLRRRVRG